MDRMHQHNETFQGSLSVMGLPPKLLHQRSAQKNVRGSNKLLDAEGPRHWHPTPDILSPSLEVRLDGGWQTKGTHEPSAPLPLIRGF